MYAVQSSLVGLSMVLAACGQSASFTERAQTRQANLGAADQVADHREPAASTGGVPNQADTNPSRVKAQGDPAGAAGAHPGTVDPASNNDKPAKADPTPPAAPVDPGFIKPGTEPDVVVQRLKKLPKMGMLVNDLTCGLCHVSVIGDVVSTREVLPPRSDSHTDVTGRWLAATTFDAGNWVVAAGGIHTDYRGPELPLPATAGGQPTFPTLDVASLADKVAGSVVSTGAFAASVARVYKGNLVLTGTPAAPIKISGDVLVQGDLVIKGSYTGNGTIYVTGNIWMPADLKSLRSAFPYPDDPAAALTQAQAQVDKADTDSLGLATANSVLIGDLEVHAPQNCGGCAGTVYTHPTVPANRRADALKIFDVYAWFPGGKAGYDAMYEKAVACANGEATELAAFNMIEAFLYAGNTVAGIARASSYTIRGGVVADYMHVLSGAANCPATPSLVHGRPQNHSYIEYDYRMKTGQLKLLEHLAERFPQPTDP